MKIFKEKNYDKMSERAAHIIAAEVISNPKCLLGLATGSTPEGLYAKLVEWCDQGIVDFSKVRTVNLDEYKGLPKENDQSYYYFMNDKLFSHVNIDKKNTHLPDGTIEDADAACKKYDEVMEEQGEIAIQLLGLGHNGHIGFNEPSNGFSVGTNCVELQASTIEANKRFFEKEEDVPRFAYTMGIGSIMKAKKILLVANGEGKAEILHSALTGPVTPKVPASILQLHPNVVVVADEAAMKYFK